MNRRELMGSLTGIIASLGVAAKAEIIDDESKPLLAVIRIDHPISFEVAASIRAAWESLWIGLPAFPCVVLEPGVELEVIVDPRERK